jgi:DNA mismatch repair protein MSH4
MLQLRTVIRSLPVVQAAVSTSHSDLLRAVSTLLQDDRFISIEAVIAQSLNEKACASSKVCTTVASAFKQLLNTLHLQKGGLDSVNTKVYAVKPNYNRLLDVARETYRENIEDIYKLNTSAAEEYNLPLSLVYKEKGCGFWFTMRKDEASGQLPKEFLNVTTTGTKMVFSSLELVSFDLSGTPA